MNGRRSLHGHGGFTLMELIMVIMLITIVSVAVAVKWPADMARQAAHKEFTRAVRAAQHLALTREWAGVASSWGIRVRSNKYYVGRADSDCIASCANTGCAGEELCDRFLLGDPGVALSNGTVFFNGLGEPIDGGGNPLGNFTFTVDGSSQLTVCAQTGYVMEGGTCP